MHNAGGGSFTVSNLCPQASNNVQAFGWGDYDNDGLPDILICSNNVVQIWKNYGNGIFSDIHAPGLPTNFNVQAAAWGDFNRDGLQDILLSGFAGANGTTQIWKNNGNGTFSNVNVGLPALVADSVEWGDFNNDGWPDLLICDRLPTSPFTPFTQIWVNTGSNFFVQDMQAALPGLSLATWGDYDNDGRLDVLVSGFDAVGNPTTEVWRNIDNSNFTQVATPGGGIAGELAIWGDFNNDGRLDVFGVGLADGVSPPSQVWQNEVFQPNFSFANALPATPTGATLAISNTTLVFSWNGSTDRETPASDLTYNMRIGTTPGGSEILSAESRPDGVRLLPQAGNMRGQLSWSLPASFTKLYWSVQAVDGMFGGSAFSPEQSFNVLPILAPAGATSLIPGDINGDGVVDRNEVTQVLSNYLAGVTLEMTNVLGLGTSNVAFSLPNPPEAGLSVQVSTNGMDWQTLGPATVGYGFTDTNAPFFTNRFYRVVFP